MAMSIWYPPKQIRVGGSSRKGFDRKDALHTVWARAQRMGPQCGPRPYGPGPRLIAARAHFIGRMLWVWAHNLGPGP